MSSEDRRAAALIQIRQATGISMDFWDDLLQDLDTQALVSIDERADSISPMYMKSKVT